MRKYFVAFLDLFFNPGEENSQGNYSTAEIIFYYVLFFVVFGLAAIVIK